MRMRAWARECLRVLSWHALGEGHPREALRLIRACLDSVDAGENAPPELFRLMEGYFDRSPQFRFSRWRMASYENIIRTDLVLAPEVIALMVMARIGTDEALSAETALTGGLPLTKGQRRDPTVLACEVLVRMLLPKRDDTSEQYFIQIDDVMRQHFVHDVLPPPVILALMILTDRPGSVRSLAALQDFSGSRKMMGTPAISEIQFLAATRAANRKETDVEPEVASQIVTDASARYLRASSHDPAALRLVRRGAWSHVGYAARVQLLLKTIWLRPGDACAYGGLLMELTALHTTEESRRRDAPGVLGLSLREIALIFEDEAAEVTWIPFVSLFFCPRNNQLKQLVPRELWIVLLLLSPDFYRPADHLPMFLLAFQKMLGVRFLDKETNDHPTPPEVPGSPPREFRCPVVEAFVRRYNEVAPSDSPRLRPKVLVLLSRCALKFASLEDRP